MNQPLPHSHEAEQCVIGGLLLDPDKWDAVSERVSHGDFYGPVHATLYRAIQRLIEASQPLDAVTLAESLPETDYTLCGGLPGILELQEAVVTSANLLRYAEIVREHAIERRLVITGHEIINGSGDVQGRIEAAQNALHSLQEDGTAEGPVGMDGLLSETMEHLDRLVQAGGGLTGRPTGFKDIDQATAGLQDGDMIVVAGRPSMGKTAFMMNIAEEVLLQDDGAVVVFSLEMPRTQLITRMLSGLAHVEFEKIRRGNLDQDELDRIATGVSVLHKKPLEVDDDASVTPSVMRTRLKQVRRKHGKIALVVVDYLQLMNGSGKENRTQQVSEISRRMKLIAKEFQCPIIVGSQLNRSLEQRVDKRPVMSDLRESGAIEQDADVIFALYRDEVYNPTSPDKGLAEVLILKQRNGPIGRHRLAFRGQYVRYSDYCPQELEPVYSGYGDGF